MEGQRPHLVIMDEAADADSNDPFALLEETPEKQAARAAHAAAAEQKEADESREVTMASFYETAPWWLTGLLRSLKIWRNVAWTYSSEERVEAGLVEDGRQPAPRISEAEAVSSTSNDRVGHNEKPMHVLALDIDHSAVLVPSTTSGHSHLVINHWLDDEAWREIITVLGKHGVIEDGYAEVSLKRGGTFLRLPWIRKRHERQDQLAAYLDWLDLPAGQDYTASSAEWLAWSRAQSSADVIVSHTDVDLDPF